MSGNCVIASCNEKQRLNSYFCPAHEEQWLASPERKRANDIDTAHHTLTMLSDFVKRVSGEERW